MNSGRVHDSFEHLMPLLEPNATGAMKLIAAWGGLQTETQIRVLDRLNRVGYPDHFAKKIRRIAFDSPNSYVRYLAVQGLSLKEDESDSRKWREQIEEDEDPLVRYAGLETPTAVFDTILKDPRAFVGLPQAARVAKVRALEDGGEEVARIVDHVVDRHLPNGSVSEDELGEILSAYVDRDAFRRAYTEEEVHDGWGQYRRRSDIKELWRLVPKLPKGPAYILLSKLPADAGFDAGIPDDLLTCLDEWQLGVLLHRDDMVLKKLRKKLFFEDEREMIRSAACAHNFDLSPEEFAQILAKPERERIRSLSDLSSMGNDLSLTVLDATNDALFACEPGAGGLSAPFEWARFAKGRFLSRIKALRGWRRRREILQLRLYRLAVAAVPWKRGTGERPSEGLAFLNACVAPGDTWGTYCRMSAAWDRKRNPAGLERQLPRIIELDEDPWDLIDDRAGLEVRLLGRLGGIVEAIEAGPDASGPFLPDLLEGVASDLGASEQRINDRLEELARLMTTLRPLVLAGLVLLVVLLAVA